MKSPVPLVCALALLLAAVTGAVSGTVSAQLTTATAPDTPRFGVQSPTNFTEIHASGEITANGGLRVGGDIALGDIGEAGNATQITVDDTDQQVILGNPNGTALIVEPGTELLNAITLKLLAKRHTAISTANVTLNGQTQGSFVTNLGATGAITATLQGAAAGANYCFYVAAAQALNIDPATGDQIGSLTNAAGDMISNSTAGSSVCLVAVDATNWLPVGVVGTWTDEN
jgi:hypothetical protein